MGDTRRRGFMLAAILATVAVVVTAVLWLALPAPPPVRPFTGVYKGDTDYRYDDGEFEGGCAIIRTSTDWSAFWSKHVSLITPKPPVPSVDFDVHMVLGCFLGWQSSSGPSIEIERIVLSETSYVVYVNRNYTLTQLPAVTNPCHLVQAPASPEQVMFFDTATGEQISRFTV